MSKDGLLTVAEQFVIVIVNSRCLQRPQKQICGNQLIHGRLLKTKSIGSGQIQSVRRADSNCHVLLYRVDKQTWKWNEFYFYLGV